MRLLMIGGTQFVGRHLVDAALARGHEVTLFTRGRSAPDLYPQAIHLRGDRDSDLTALAEGSWDATVDVCAYVPRQVHQLAAALGDRGGRHVLISTVSVYAPPPGPGATEDAELVELADPATEEVTGETYGGLKVLVERAAVEHYGDDLLTIRPTYVVGPHDYTGRFTWWLERLARGGQVLVPGPPDSPLQVIDARDQAEFVVSLVEAGQDGRFHTASPQPPFSFADMLDVVASEVAPAGTSLQWVGVEEVVAELGETAHTVFPLWGGADEDVWSMALDASAALAAGLSPRPLAQTVRETWAWAQQHPGTTAEVGLAPEREAAWLAR